MKTADIELLAGVFSSDKNVRKATAHTLFEGLDKQDPKAEALLVALFSSYRPEILENSNLANKLQAAGWPGDLAGDTQLSFNIRMAIGIDEEVFPQGVPQLRGTPGIIVDPIPSYADIRKVVPEFPSDEELYYLQRIEGAFERFRYHFWDDIQQRLPILWRACVRILSKNDLNIDRIGRIFSGRFRGEEPGWGWMTLEESDSALGLGCYIIMMHPMNCWDEVSMEACVRAYGFMKKAINCENEETRSYAIVAIHRMLKEQKLEFEKNLLLEAQAILFMVAEFDASAKNRAYAIEALAECRCFDTKKSAEFILARIQVDEVEPVHLGVQFLLRGIHRSQIPGFDFAMFEKMWETLRKSKFPFVAHDANFELGLHRAYGIRD